jgi:hypothetical protein
MDMKNILQNMDAAASGDKPSADTKDVNSMKTILESIQECGSPMMAGQEMPMASEGGQPVTVSITASGKDNVSDLIAMMQDAAGITQMGPAVTDEPKMLPAPDGDDQEMDMATMRDLIVGKPDEPTEENYANSPDPEYGDMSDVIPDGNDLNRKKKAYPATQDGDNPMAVEAIKAALYAALTEKKKTMVKGPDGKMVPDYAADGKGKGDLKKDTKTTEGRGKVMAGRGRGKDKLMAGRGRGKKK